MPGPVARLVQDGLDFLDAPCVLRDVQGNGAHPGAGVFLKLSDLAAELLVKPEAGGAGADGMQGPDAGLLVRRPQPGQDGTGVRRGLAAVAFAHARSVNPAAGQATADFAGRRHASAVHDGGATVAS